MNGEQLKTAAIPGSVSKVIDSGRPGASLKAWNPVRICSGSVEGIEYPRESIAAHTNSVDATGELPSAPVSIVIQEQTAPRRRIRLEAHNEIFLALADGRAVASAPDQILIINQRDRTVLNVENLRIGAAIDVVVIHAAAPEWRTPAGRRLMQLSGHAVAGFYNLSSDVGAGSGS